MASVSFVTSANSGATGGASTHTYTGLDFGAADNDRFIIVTGSWVRQNDNFALSSATIGGVAATIGGQVGWNLGTDEGLVFIIWAKVPTGTTGNVALTFDNTMLGGTVGVFRTVASTISANDSASNGSVTTNPLPLDVDTLSGWFGIGAGGFNDSTSPSSSWTGLTQGYSSGVGGGLSNFGSGAYENFVSSETPRTVSATRSDATNECAALVISFTGTDVPSGGGAAVNAGSLLLTGVGT